MLDIVLLHCLTRSNWPKRYAGALEALSRAQEQGKVRAVGISSHNLGVLKAAAKVQWGDVILARINHAGVNMDAQPHRVAPVLDKLYTSGKAVYGMKVYGAGKLTDDRRNALEYVFQLGTVYSVTIGTSSLTQLKENVRLIADIAPHYPLKPA